MDSNPKPPSIPPWATLSSGAASGLASCLLLQPMDLLKTRMQQQVSAERHLVSEKQQHHNDGQINEQRKRGGPSKRTQRLINTTKSVLRDDGVRGLWRGTVPTVARNVPGVALYFYSVSEIRALLAQADIPYLAIPPSSSSSSSASKLVESTSPSTSSTLARLTVAGNLISGAVARVSVGFLLSPITIVKARFESSHFSKTSYPSLSKALIQIYTNEGVRGLFRGFSATAMRDAPYAGIYLASYEKCKHALGKWERAGERGSGNSVVIGVSGLFAGALATLITHPFDIIKTRLQTSPIIANKLTRSASVLTTAKEIIRIDGMGAFLDGLGLRCARKAASSAIGWTIFEAGRRLWLRTEMQRREDEQSSIRISQ